jgi:hypothetical protein
MLASFPTPALTGSGSKGISQPASIRTAPPLQGLFHHEGAKGASIICLLIERLQSIQGQRPQGIAMRVPKEIKVANKGDS